MIKYKISYIESPKLGITLRRSQLDEIEEQRMEIAKKA